MLARKPFALDTLLLAREMGYMGVALKACKGQ
jgi:hypothetical protein